MNAVTYKAGGANCSDPFKCVAVLQIQTLNPEAPSRSTGMGCIPASQTVSGSIQLSTLALTRLPALLQAQNVKFSRASLNPEHQLNYIWKEESMIAFWPPP